MENVIDFLKKFRRESKNTNKCLANKQAIDSLLSLSIKKFKEMGLAVLVRSHLLGEDIYLISNRDCLQKVNGNYVTYLPEEIMAIYNLSNSGIKDLHRLKKIFDGEIVGKGSTLNEKNVCLKNQN